VSKNLVSLVYCFVDSNELRELPQSMGRMTRLVVLNVSDNKLTDLPLTMGRCIGLSKFGMRATFLCGCTIVRFRVVALLL
jgi:Leucine-rich repeat (LRR) protein